MPGRPLQQLLPIDSFDVGSILYLRRREEVLDEHVVAAQIEDGFLDHPCLVVEKPKSRKDYVCICPVTSFKGKTLSQARKPRYWHNYLPIEPSSPHSMHPDVQLRLANGAQLRKPCYLKVERVHQVHISMLESYDWRLSARDYRLDMESCEIVRQQVKMYLEIPRAEATPQVVALTNALASLPTQPTYTLPPHCPNNRTSLSAPPTYTPPAPNASIPACTSASPSYIRTDCLRPSRIQHEVDTLLPIHHGPISRSTIKSYSTNYRTLRGAQVHEHESRRNRQIFYRCMQGLVALAVLVGAIALLYGAYRGTEAAFKWLLYIFKEGVHWFENVWHSITKFFGDSG